MKRQKPLMKHSSRIRIYQYTVLAFAMIIAFTPTLYAGMSQADLRVVITAMGIDKADDGTVTLSAVTIVPQESEARHHAVTAEGNTIADAFQNLSIRTGRLPETGHCEILIVGKAAAQKGIDAELKFLFCTGLLSGGAAVLVCEEDAAGFLEEEAGLNAEAIRINHLIRYAKRGAHVVIRTLHGYLSQTASAQQCTVVPLTAIKNGEYQGVERAVVFDAGGALVKVLDKEQTTGVALLDRNTKSGTITLPDFEVDGQKLGNISGRLRGKSARIRVEQADNGLRAAIRLNVRLRLPERHILSPFWNDVSARNRINALLEEQFADEIKSKVQSAADVSKETEKDILGIMQSLRRRNRSLFAVNPDPAQVMRSIEYVIEVNCKVS